ncbi:MAG: hypothetical protein H7Y88_07970 [Phycisphaerales bacterium]|nr:hypothetical protein [Phycisphaerales bacterium]
MKHVFFGLGLAAGLAASTAAMAQPASGGGNAPADGGAARVAILNLGPPEPGEVPADLIGIHITAAMLEAAIPLLEQDKVDTVVLRINSTGGNTDEIAALHEMIQSRYAKKFRTVAWVRNAGGAGGITVLSVPEWYFHTAGTFGPAQAGGMGVGKEERELLLDLGKKVGESSGRPSEFIRAVQAGTQVSVDVDSAGAAVWQEGDAGGFKLNEPRTPLVLTAADAERVKLSKGTARTKEDLAEVMGLKKVEWAGESATKAMDEAREDVVKADAAADMAYRGYLKALGAANRAAKKDRAALITDARGKLDALYKLWQEKPVLAKLYPFNKGWYDQQVGKLTELEAKK